MMVEGPEGHVGIVGRVQHGTRNLTSQCLATVPFMCSMCPLVPGLGDRLEVRLEVVRALGR